MMDKREGWAKGGDGMRRVEERAKNIADNRYLFNCGALAGDKISGTAKTHF